TCPNYGTKNSSQGLRSHRSQQLSFMEGQFPLGGSCMKPVRLGRRNVRSKFTYAIYLVAIAGVFAAGTFILGSRAPGFVGPSQMPGSPGEVEGYSTHVATDKPIYRAGEKVYVRGVVLRADGHTPITNVRNSPTTASFEIKGPKGE